MWHFVDPLMPQLTSLGSLPKSAAISVTHRETVKKSKAVRAQRQYIFIPLPSLHFR